MLIVFVGGAAFSVHRIGGREWGISLALGLVSLPLGAAIRYIPNGPCEAFFKKVRLMPNPDILPTTRADAETGLGFAINRVHDNLGTFSQVRGGRMRGSSFVGKSRAGKVDETGAKKKPASELLTMLPTLMMSNIVSSNWMPTSGGSLSDPAGFDPSVSSAELWKNKYEVHPDTPPNDPVFQIFRQPPHSPSPAR